MGKLANLALFTLFVLVIVGVLYLLSKVNSKEFPIIGYSLKRCDVSQPYSDIETYTEREPYEKQETYTENEPYTDTECKDVQVPYSDQECTNVQVPSTAQECHTEQESYQVTVSKNKVIFDEYSTTVYAGTYTYVYFTFDLTGKSSNVVSGSFTEKAGYDINFYIFDQQNFNNWKSGGSYTTYVSYPRSSGASFSFVPPKSDVYYFVFDNKYSWFTNKVPEMSATWTWQEQETRYRDKQVCENVIRYSTEQQCQTVTKYRTEQQCSEVTKVREINKTRTVTAYRDVQKSRTVTRYRTVEQVC